MYQPTEQVKRLASLLGTLDQKQAEVKLLEQDMNSKRLALEKAQRDLVQVREQVSVELAKLDPGLPPHMGIPTTLREPGQAPKKAAS